MTQTQELNVAQSKVYDGFHAIIAAAIALHAALPEEPWVEHLDSAIVKLSKIAGAIESVGDAVTEASQPKLPEAPQK